jgi:AcrR family transcriptional regulator
MSKLSKGKSGRLTREQAAAQTRELLLASARTVFIEHGYQDSSIYEIAERAGRTIGALYAHFGNKEGIFLALWDRHFAEALDRYASWVAESGGQANLPTAAGEFWTRFLRQDPDVFRLFIEFWSHALRDQKLRERFMASLRRLHAAIATVIEKHQRALDVTLNVSPGEIAVVFEALVDGFALHKLADPDDIDDALLGRAFTWLVTGLLADTQPSAR